MRSMTYAADVYAYSQLEMVPACLSRSSFRPDYGLQQNNIHKPTLDTSATYNISGGPF